jgi:hypothetical protein
MRRKYTWVIFCLLLVLGLSSAVPAEDLPDTNFDESETHPSEISLLIPTLTEQTASRTQMALSETQAAQNSLRPQTTTLFRLSLKSFTRPVGHRFAEPQGVLSQICTLLL